MVKRIIIVALSILLCVSPSIADYREEINSKCTEKYSSNNAKRNECIETQIKAAEFWYENYIIKYVAAFVAADDKDPNTTYMLNEATIVYECAKRFQDSAGRYNYRMVLDCCDYRFEEYKASKK